MSNIKQKFTLDRPARYQIKVPGVLDEGWLGGDGNLVITVGSDGDDGPLVTTMTVIVDQAALHGLLRQLYSLGVPLISVNHEKTDDSLHKDHKIE